MREHDGRCSASKKKKKPVLLACFEHHHLIDLCACVCVCMCAELLAAYKLGLHYVLRDVFLSRRFASFIFLFLNCRCLSKKVEKTNSSSKDLRFFFFFDDERHFGPQQPFQLHCCFIFPFPLVLLR